MMHKLQKGINKHLTVSMKLLFTMKYFSILVLAVSLFNVPVTATNKGGAYTVETVAPHFPVIDQGSTGTCWSFATTSFLESEIIRKGFPKTDLSEMFFVYYTYKNRAKRYILFHGNNNHTQGGQAHDVIHVLREAGMVTQNAFSGIVDGTRHNHRNLSTEVRQEANRLNDSRNGFSAEDLYTFDQILTTHLGEIPERFEYEAMNFRRSNFAIVLKSIPMITSS